MWLYLKIGPLKRWLNENEAFGLGSNPIGLVSSKKRKFGPTERRQGGVSTEGNHVRAQRRQSIYKARRKASGETNAADTLTLDCWPPSTGCLSGPVMAFSDGSPGNWHVICPLASAVHSRMRNPHQVRLLRDASLTTQHKQRTLTLPVFLVMYHSLAIHTFFYRFVHYLPLLPYMLQ